MEQLELLRRNLARVEARIEQACQLSARQRSEITLIAVTKSTTSEVAALLPQMGIADLAESRPQELWNKAAAVPQARWHFIGHMQRNKIDRSLPLVSLFHSIDSFRLLEALSTWGEQNHRQVEGLIEVNISGEGSKGGFSLKELEQAEKFIFPGVRLKGLMGMAALDCPGEKARGAFQLLRQTRDRFSLAAGMDLPFLSMGMSSDFEAAVKEGATHLRLGTILFQEPDSWLN